MSLERDKARGKLGSEKYVQRLMRACMGFFGDVLPTDGRVSAFEKAMDYDCCVDGFAFNEKFGVIPYASRVQFGKNYEAFSIRYTRENGLPTEWQKICTALDEGEMGNCKRPFVHVQVFVDETGNAVAGMVRTDKLFEFMRNNRDKIKKFTNADGSSFLACYWRDLKKASVDVIRFSIPVDAKISVIKGD